MLSDDSSIEYLTTEQNTKDSRVKEHQHNVICNYQNTLKSSKTTGMKGVTIRIVHELPGLELITLHSPPWALSS